MHARTIFIRDPVVVVGQKVDMSTFGRPSYVPSIGRSGLGGTKHDNFIHKYPSRLKIDLQGPVRVRVQLIGHL